MRKFWLFIVLIPFFFSLGHDLYMFYSKPETRFHFSDVGFLWSKFHKQSHDQWKSVLIELGGTVNKSLEFIPTPKTEKTIEASTEDQNLPNYGESFTQIDKDENAIANIPTERVRKAAKRVEPATNIVGTILECRGVFVSGIFALIVFLLNHIISNKARNKDYNSSYSLKPKKKYKYFKK